MFDQRFSSHWKSHSSYHVSRARNRNFSKFAAEYGPLPRSIISMKCSFGIRRRISGTTRQIGPGKERGAHGIRSRCSRQVRKSLASNPAVLSGELYRCRTCRVPSGWILRPRGNYILGWNAGSQQCEKRRKRAEVAKRKERKDHEQRIMGTLTPLRARRCNAWLQTELNSSKECFVQLRRTSRALVLSQKKMSLKLGNVTGNLRNYTARKTNKYFVFVRT